MKTKNQSAQSIPSDLPVHLPSVTKTVAKLNKGETVRIAIVVSHPIQHFAPWHRKFATLSGVEVKVFFCMDWGANTYFDRDFGTEVKWDIPLLDGYVSEFLPLKQPVNRVRFRELDNPTVTEALDSFHPDVVQIFGYAYRTMWRTARWCHRKKIPLLLYSDSNASARRPLWRRAFKALVVGRFYRWVDAALFNGDNNYEYHARYGLPADRLFQGALPIDKERLVHSVGDPLAARGETRRRHGIPDDAFVAVFSGKLSVRKSPLDLVNAIARCVEQGANIWALIAGEGRERQGIEQLLAKNKIRNVVLAGFVNQSEIAKYYAASDVLVVPSEYDPHPLVVPEAGCFGLPAIASDRLGCIGKSDTARPGENTLVYPYSDVDALTRCLIKLYEDKTLYKSMSESARRIADSQDIAVAALQLKEAATRLKAMGCRR